VSKPERWTWVEDMFRGGYSGIVDQDGTEVLFADCCNDGDEGAAWFDTFPSEAHRLLIADAPRLKEANADLLAACQKLTNIAEVVGHCVGEWTAEHQALAQQYAREGREAIAKAKTGGEPC